MVRVTASVRWSALLATAAIMVAFAATPVRALDQRQLTGWWIVIDDTLPKLWRQRTIAPMEEIVQIFADGRVSDRVMNFWAGGNRPCLENKVCSDIPQISVSRLSIAGNRIGFLNVVVSTARLDSETGDPVIRRDAVTATPAWIAAIDGDRLTLHVNKAKVRTLVRIDPDRLKKLRAGMRISGLPADEHWRCFLGNATAQEKAFAPLHAGHSYSTPDFLDRYLQFASYLDAIRSSIAIPAIDETNEERRKLLSVETEELMVAHFDGVLRPPSIDERHRLNAVLAYVDQHSRTMIVYNAAAAVEAQAKARADAAASEAARTASAARGATAATAAASANAKSAADAAERARAASMAQAKAAQDAATAAREAETVAKSKDNDATTATGAHEAAKRSAEAQRVKADAAKSLAADRQQTFDAASRHVADMQRQLEAAKRAATEQQQKSETAALDAAGQQRKYDAAKHIDDERRQAYQSAKLAADLQQQKSAKLAAAARAYAGSLADLQKKAEDTAALIGHTDNAAQQFNSANADAASGPVAPDAADIGRDLRDALDTLEAALKVTTAALKIALGSRDRAEAGAAAASTLATQLAAAADGARQRSAAAHDAATAADIVRNQAKTAADTAARQADELAGAARNAATRVAEATDAAKIAETARDSTKTDAAAQAQESAKLADAAAAAGAQASAALGVSKAAAAARDKAKSDAEAASRESARRADAAQNAAKLASAANEAVKAASEKEQQAKSEAGSAAQVSAKANAELRAASNVASTANDAMRAAAAAQPKGDGLMPITVADIAAYAHVMDNGADAKKLFCRDEYRSDAPAAVKSASSHTPAAAQIASAGANATTGAAPGAVKVPLPVARPSAIRR